MVWCFAIKKGRSTLWHAVLGSRDPYGELVDHQALQGA